MGNKNKHKNKVSIFDDEFEEELEELEKSDEFDELEEVEEKPKYESSKESKKEEKNKKYEDDDEDEKIEEDEVALKESKKEDLEDDDIDFDDLWVKKDKKDDKKSDNWKHKKDDKKSKHDEDEEDDDDWEDKKDSKRDEKDLDDDEDIWESKSKKDKSKKVIVPIDKDDEDDWKNKKDSKKKDEDEEDDDDLWESKSSKKDDKHEDKKKDVLVGKELKKDKDDEEEDDDDDEESSSIGVKIVLGIIILAIIIVLLLKSCNSPSEGEFVVSFDTNGGTRIADVMVEEDGKLQEPVEPTKEGYEFAGWYYNDELYDFEKPVTGDIELEARWVEAAVVNVSGVELDQSTIKLSPGGTASLVATVNPANAKDKSLTWESSDPAVVTVDGEGNITAVKSGTAKITVKTTDGGFTATATVTVSKDVVAATGVTLNKTTLSIGPNETSTLKATVNPSNASNKGVTWTSSDTSVATVSSTGVVTGKKDGNAVITVTTKDGGHKTVCNVTVKTVKVTGVKATNETATVKVGKTATLKATVAPSNATNKKVTWKSENPDVVKVSASGVITGVSEGKANVIVTTADGSFTDTIEVTVKPIVLAESVSITGNDTVEIGKTITLKATVNPSDTDDKTVKWTSSDPKKATVSSKGVVKGVEAGKVTITATTSNGKTATKEITIKEKPATYTATMTAEYTGEEISAWNIVVYKNGSKTTDFKGIACGDSKSSAAASKFATVKSETSSCTVTLSDGSTTSAKATWKK